MIFYFLLWYVVIYLIYLVSRASKEMIGRLAYIGYAGALFMFLINTGYLISYYAA